MSLAAGIALQAFALGKLFMIRQGATPASGFGTPQCVLSVHPATISRELCDERARHTLQFSVSAFHAADQIVMIRLGATLVRESQINDSNVTSLSTLS